MSIVKEFRLGPGETTQVGKITLGNFSSVGKWYIIQEKAGKYLIGNVNRPEYVLDPTLRDAEELPNTDPI